MHFMYLLFPVLVLALGAVAPGASAQVRHEQHGLERPVAVETGAARLPISRSPLLRTVAAVAGSAAGFAYVRSREESSDDLLVPMAAGAAASTFAAFLFTDAHPLKIVVGSALGVLPAGALANFLVETVDEEEQGHYPLIVFSVPQGLVTSAFAQRRR